MEIVLVIIGLVAGYAGAGFQLKSKHSFVISKLQQTCDDMNAKLSTIHSNHEAEKNQILDMQKAQADKSVSTISDVLDLSADSSDATSQSLTAVTQQIQTLTEMVAMIIDLSNSTANISDNGMVNIDSVVKNLAELSQSKEDLAMILTKFNEVQDKTKAIRFIGEEAEMLALNAAIEAARAGDAGRGFAVVASSMKSLAKNSQNTTHEILSIVQESDRVISDVAKSFSERGEKLNESIGNLVKNFTQINISVTTIQSHAKLITSDSEGISTLMKESASNTKTSVENTVKQLSEVISVISGKRVIDLSPKEAQEQWNSFDDIIDVRRAEEWELELGHIEGVRLSTLQTDFKQDVFNLDKNKKYLFVCRSGGRSTKAAQMAIAKGVEKVYNLDGGMLEWRKQRY